MAATAGGICAELTQMFDATFEPQIHADLAANMQCGTSTGQSGQTAQHCRWPFAFRAIEARTAFEEMSEQILHCLGEAALQPDEGDVNHPDTYDQRLFLTDRGRVSLALKDKGALQQTFVFLRVEATGAGD